MYIVHAHIVKVLKATRLHISEQWQLATGLMLKTLHSDVLNPDGWMRVRALEITHCPVDILLD